MRQDLKPSYGLEVLVEGEHGRLVLSRHDDNRGVREAQDACRLGAEGVQGLGEAFGAGYEPNLSRFEQRCPDTQGRRATRKLESRTTTGRLSGRT